MIKKKTAFITAVLILCSQFYACTVKEPAGKDRTDTWEEIAARPAFGKAPLTVSFDAGTSLNQYSGEPSLLWDFDDRSISTEVSPEHTFNVMGTYMVSLTVIRPDGLRDAFWTTVIVN
jgi:PKD repeat protein